MTPAQIEAQVCAELPRRLLPLLIVALVLAAALLPGCASLREDMRNNLDTRALFERLDRAAP